MIPLIGRAYKKAIAIVIGNRFFCRFGVRGRVQTAWSLAGARLFLEAREDLLSDVERRLRKKGIIDSKRVRVSVVDEEQRSVEDPK